jgi:ATP-dependent protease ClpP protease subunit
MPRQGKQGKTRKKKSADTESADESDEDVAVRVRGNHIYFWCDVTKKSSLDLIMALQKVDETERSKVFHYSDDDRTPIYLHVNSYGGDVDAALGVADTIEHLTSHGARVVTIVEGTAASAATLISCVGTSRRIRPNATMRIHNFTSFLVGKKNAIDEEYDNLNKLEETLVKFYKKRTLMTATQIKKLFASETDLGPKECVRLGLIDKMIS